MKLLMSIGNKFFTNTPMDLVDMIVRHSNNIDGFEIAIDYFNKDHQKYLFDLAFECQKCEKNLQIHADINYGVEEQFEFFEICDKLADVLGYKIVLVYHPVYELDKDESIRKTSIYFSKMLEKVKENNHQVIITIENLNDDNYIDRLSKEDIIPIVYNNENLYFTYDIGHEIADYGKIINLDPILIERMMNVHFHTFNLLAAHQPIYENDKHKEQIIKGITYLNCLNYDKTIVFEYDFYQMTGKTYEDKVINYIKSIDYVAEYFK